MVGNQLGVLPDGDDIGEVEDGSVLLDIVALGLGDVDLEAIDGGSGASGLALVADLMLGLECNGAASQCYQDPGVETYTDGAALCWGVGSHCEALRNELEDARLLENGDEFSSGYAGRKRLQMAGSEALIRGGGASELLVGARCKKVRHFVRGRTFPPTMEHQRGYM